MLTTLPNLTRSALRWSIQRRFADLPSGPIWLESMRMASITHAFDCMCGEVIEQATDNEALVAQMLGTDLLNDIKRYHDSK